MKSARRRPPDLPGLLEQLEALHGRPQRLPPRSALDWILWENAAYLVSDERRAAAYAALKRATGLSAAGLLALPREELRELAALGGMQPEGRVEKWLRIAHTVQDEFDGDLQSVLSRPNAEARRALKRFPGIGDPGADKILLFTRTAAVPALESNGVRSLVRLGLAAEAKSYSTTYRAATRALAPLVSAGCPALIRAFELLRRHGQELCKFKVPRCESCPLAEACPSAT